MARLCTNENAFFCAKLIKLSDFKLIIKFIYCLLGGQMKKNWRFKNVCVVYVLLCVDISERIIVSMTVTISETVCQYF